MDFLSPILGAGASIASALIGGSNKDKSLAGNYIMPDRAQVGWKNGRLSSYSSTGEWNDVMDSTVFF